MSKAKNLDTMSLSEIQDLVSELETAAGDALHRAEKAEENIQEVEAQLKEAKDRIETLESALNDLFYELNKAMSVAQKVV
jgi:hypothetical protein